MNARPGYRLETRKGPVDLTGPTRVMGILNVTPDSFSDGGRYLAPEAAVARGLELERDGAAILDVGGFSSRPGSTPPPEDEELARVLPVVRALAPRLRIPISVDTTRPRVFAAAFEAGADILNDISALGAGEEMLAVLRATGAPAVLMHMRGEPATMQVDPRYGDVVAEVAAHLAGRLDFAERGGVPRARLVIDPGLGFGKTLEHNLDLLARADAFLALGAPVLYGASRKGFLGKILDRSESVEREWATSATTAHLYTSGVHVVRVHDARAAADVIAVLDRIQRHSDARARPAARTRPPTPRV